MTANRVILLMTAGISLLTAQGPVVPPVPLKATQIYNITAATVLDCSRTIFACIDNRNIQRQNNYHSYRAVGTGTWSVDMQFADNTATGFVSYGSTAQVSNASPASAIGYGIDPTSITGGRRFHDFIKFVITGNAQIVSYNGLKDVWSLPSAGAISFPVTPNQGGTGGTTTSAWTGILGYLSGLTGAVERTAQSLFGEKVSVKDFHALGDGSTDDTAAITLAINAACTSGARLRIPAGTYIIAPPSTAQILPVCSNLSVDGDGWGVSVLRVKASSGSYNAVFGPSFAVVSHVSITNFTIDQNSANNTAPSGADLLAHPRFILAAGTGSDALNVNGMEFLNIQSINTFYVQATGANITRNRFSIYGGGTAWHDHSTLYMAADGAVVANNQFQGVVNGAGSTTAIETHGGQHAITGNRIDSFEIGMNITGVGPTEASGVGITGNTITNGYNGITLWSQTCPIPTCSVPHLTGYGLTDVTATGNVVRLKQVSWTTNPVTGAAINGLTSGITLNVTNSLPVKAINITGNVVEFDLSASAADLVNNGSIGIGYWDSLSQNAAMAENLKISDNIILNAPSNAIRFASGGKGIEISRNQITNPGSSLNVSLITPFRAGIFLAGPASGIQDFRALDNIITDNLTTTRMGYGMEFVTSQVGDMIATGTIVNVTGSITSALIRPVDANNNTQIPLITAWVNAPSIAGSAILPFTSMGQGSWIYDVVAKKRYQVTSGGNTWTAITTGTASPSTGTASQGDVQMNSTPTGATPTFAWICTAGGSPGTWVPVGPFTLSGDVTNVGLVSSVAFVGGSSAAAVHASQLLTAAATTAATASTLAIRDPNGNLANATSWAIGQGATQRWVAFLSGAESGGNAGSAFALAAYSDIGGFLETALIINRVSGDMTIPTSAHVLAPTNDTASVLTTSATQRVFNKAFAITDGDTFTGLLNASANLADVANNKAARDTLMYVAAPTVSASACTVGQQSFSSTFFYICAAANTWVRAALATW